MRTPGSDFEPAQGFLPTKGSSGPATTCWPSAPVAGGKASLDAVRRIGRFSPGSHPATVAAATLKAMPGQLRSAQKVFDSAGGAPSSLAVSLAEDCGVTLVAFLREDSMNVYTRAGRIT